MTTYVNCLKLKTLYSMTN